MTLGRPRRKGLGSKLRFEFGVRLTAVLPRILDSENDFLSFLALRSSSAFFSKFFLSTAL
jgi:hypothetical protein